MRLAIFFNNNRGYVLLNKLKRKHEICLAILSKKYLNKKITKYLKRLKVPYLITNKINTKTTKITKINHPRSPTDEQKTNEHMAIA